MTLIREQIMVAAGIPISGKKITSAPIARDRM
jgi:hypothetical protein